MADGIHRDGTFLQHAGLLYNANYGKDLVSKHALTRYVILMRVILLTLGQFNAFIQMGGEVRGTSFAVNQATQDAIAAQARGNEWMIFARQDTHREMFDYVCTFKPYICHGIANKNRTLLGDSFPSPRTTCRPTRTSTSTRPSWAAPLRTLPDRPTSTTQSPDYCRTAR